MLKRRSSKIVMVKVDVCAGGAYRSARKLCNVFQAVLGPHGCVVMLKMLKDTKSLFHAYLQSFSLDQHHHLLKMKLQHLRRQLFPFHQCW